jgi:hypothetical protein
MLRLMAVPGSQPRRRPAFGLLLLGLGQARGLAQFGGDADSYLGSLAPLLGLQIVMALLFMLRAGFPLASLFFLIVVCNLLAPPVIGHVFCAWWGRRALWPLYANVLNWSVWLMVGVLLVPLPAASMTLSVGVSPTAAATLLLGVLALYVLWFHWFLARHALQVSRARALLVMASVVFGTGLLVQAPIWIGDVTGLQPTPELAPDVMQLSPPNGSDK